MKAILACTFFFVPFQIHASPEEKLLLATHASSYWDNQRTTEKAVSDIVAAALKKGIPIVSLEKNNIGNYIGKETAKHIHSGAGEFSFRVPNHVFSMGGYFSYCLQTTIQSLLEKSWKGSLADHSIVFLTRGIFEFRDAESYSLAEDGSLNKAEWGDIRKTLISRFPSAWGLPLSSLLANFPSKRAVFDHLSFRVRNILHVQDFFPHHRILLKVNGVEDVLQTSSENSPQFEITFSDAIAENILNPSDISRDSHKTQLTHVGFPD